jgi:hypothetical protein
MDAPTYVFVYEFEDLSAKPETEDEDESKRETNSYSNTYSVSDGARGDSYSCSPCNTSQGNCI